MHTSRERRTVASLSAFEVVTNQFAGLVRINNLRAASVLVDADSTSLCIDVEAIARSLLSRKRHSQHTTASLPKSSFCRDFVFSTGYRLPTHANLGFKDMLAPVTKGKQRKVRTETSTDREKYKFRIWSVFTLRFKHKTHERGIASCPEGGGGRAARER